MELPSISHYKNMESLTDAIRALPDQYDFKANTKHYFAHGTYVRELFIPGGIFMTGKIHKNSCINIIVTGRIRVVSSAGTHDFEGYNVLVTGPGEQKAVCTLEDTIFLNVLPWDGPEDAEIAERVLTYETYSDMERGQCLLD